MNSMKWKDPRMKPPYYPRSAPVLWEHLTNLKNTPYQVDTKFLKQLVMRVLSHAGINNPDEWVDPGVDQATVQRKLKYKPQGLPQALPDSPPPASPAREEEENVSDVSNREIEEAEREEENVSNVSSPALRRIREIRICYWLAIKLSNNQRIEQQRQSEERNNQNVSPDRQQQPRKTWSLRDSQPQQQHTHQN